MYAPKAIRFTAPLAILFAGVAQAQDTTAAPPVADAVEAPAAAVPADPLAPLLAYIGEWRIDGAWVGGQPIRATQTFQPILDGAHILTRVFVTEADGREYQRYEGTYSWDANRETYVYSSLAFDGTAVQGTFEVTGAGITFVREMPGANGVTNHLHQAIGPPRDGAYTWNVWLVSPDGTSQPLMEDGRWVKVD